MTSVQWLGEALARRLQRRVLLRRTAAAIFGSVAAGSATGLPGSAQLADFCTNVEEGACACDPTAGQYCGELDAGYCAGATCGDACTVDASWNGTGCWCSALCRYADANGNPLVGYYQCCDCVCGGVGCSCRQFQAVQQGSPTEPTPPPEHGDGSDHGGVPFPPGFPFNR
jgi:hypothetical protein